jgi:Fe-S cluster assembly ATPase SufC
VTHEELSGFNLVHYLNTQFSKAEDATDRRRQLKWKDMVAKIEKGQSINENVMKRRVRKGIPQAIRGQVWSTLANVKN